MFGWGASEGESTDDPKGKKESKVLRDENAALKAEIARLKAKATTSPAAREEGI